MQPQNRPAHAIFADGVSHAGPLALHPDAIGVLYATRKTEQIAEVKDGVAVLCVDGPLEHRGGGGWWSCWQTYEDLARDFNALCLDGAVRAIILKFDSPGGEVAGLNETVAIMRGMKVAARKPVIAYVDEACYSAAYALAMVADEIYLPESGGLGSIGVITAMADVTEADKKAGVRVEVIASGTKKTDGHPHVALTDGAIKRARKTVDRLASLFFELVASTRGLAPEAVAGFQAGLFTGQAAVDAGLADGVLSLAECLTLASKEFTSPKEPAERSVDEETSPMPGVLSAAKALNEAHAAMSAAKTEAERALCAARILAAEETVAKVKKTKTVTTDTHEEEVDDGEPEDDDEEEDDDMEEEGEKGEADEKAAAVVASPSRKVSPSDLLSLAREITGKRSIDEVMGALRGMHAAYRRTSKLAAEVAALKADAEAGKVTALIAQGLKAGKLAPAQRAWAKTQSPASLRAYLDAAPKMVHTAADEHTEARVEGTGTGAVTAEMARIWHKQGFTEKDFPKLLEKLNGAAKGANGVLT